jgi:hypothetical protein
VRSTRRFARWGMAREKAKKRLLPRHPIRRGFCSEISTGKSKSLLAGFSSVSISRTTLKSPRSNPAQA